MNSKDRVRQALNFKEPDRVPMHLNASVWITHGLKEAYGVEDDMSLLQSMGVDFWDSRGIDLHSGLGPIYSGPEHQFLRYGQAWSGNIMDLWGIEEFVRNTPFGPTLELHPPPLTLESYPQEWDSFSWPQASWFQFEGLKEQYALAEDFSVLLSGASVFQHASYIVGLDHQLMDLMIHPERSNYLHDKLLDFYASYYEQFFKELDGQVDIFALADDFGTQQSLMISRQTFQQFFQPRIRKLADLAHTYGIKLLLHTCGNVESLIPDFIHAGVDILDPIQPESMDPAQIKKEYGRDLVLRGGISSQQVMAHGDISDVQEEVKRKLDVLMPGGGYIFSPGHPVLQTDIPIENIITLYETASKYGVY